MILAARLFRECEAGESGSARSHFAWETRHRELGVEEGLVGADVKGKGKGKEGVKER